MTTSKLAVNPSHNSEGSPAASESRSKLEIVPRRVKFEFSDLDGPIYYAGNSCISAMWVALSASFPAGEGEFIKSVKLFEDQIQDPKLKEEVRDFAHQEAHHSLQHRQINKAFDDFGYSTAKINEFFKQKLKDREQQWSPEKRLARTVAAEHVTAVMAHHALLTPIAGESTRFSEREGRKKRRISIKWSIDSVRRRA